MDGVRRESAAGQDPTGEAHEQDHEIGPGIERQGKGRPDDGKREPKDESGEKRSTSEALRRPRDGGGTERQDEQEAGHRRAHPSIVRGIMPHGFLGLGHHRAGLPQGRTSPRDNDPVRHNVSSATPEGCTVAGRLPPSERRTMFERLCSL